MIVTIKNLQQATPQEVYNTITAHLLKQKKQCKDGLQSRYKNEQGLSCAAGCLIPQDLYNPKIEGLNWNYLVIKGTVPGDHFMLIRHLQHFHDSIRPEYWLDKIGFEAAKFGLIFRYDEIQALQHQMQ